MHRCTDITILTDNIHIMADIKMLSCFVRNTNKQEHNDITILNNNYCPVMASIKIIYYFVWTNKKSSIKT